MTTFINIERIKRDQAFELACTSYNRAEDYMVIAQKYRIDNKFANSKRAYAKSIHNLKRAYNIASNYDFGLIIKINTALKECGINIDEL